MGRSDQQIGAILIVFLCGAAPAFAQDPLAQARSSYEQAHFEDALAAIAEVERDREFDRETYVELLRLRATILFALGRDQWRHDLGLMATVAPEVELGPESPPPMHEAYEDIRRGAETLELDAEAETFPDGVLLTAEASGVPTGLDVRHQLFGRSGGTDWRHGPQRLMIEEPSDVVEFYAELLGPGGAILHSAGTREQPLRHVWEAPVVQPTEAAVSEEGGSVWPWVGLAGGVVVAATAVAVILFLTHEPDTRVELPRPP